MYMKKYFLFLGTVCAILLPQITFAAGRISASEASNTISESGTTATFTITLDEPIISFSGEGYVTVPLSSSDLSEGILSTSSVTFAQDNWYVPQTVTITGVDDDTDDGDSDFDIILEVALSNSEYYTGFNPTDISATNTDNDTAGIQWSSDSAIWESEAPGTVHIVLTSEPTADVTIPLASADPLEVALSESSVTFTPENWSVEQEVFLSSTDDAIDEDLTATQIFFGLASSTDPLYDGYNSGSFAIIHYDDDTAGVTVEQSATAVTEGGEAMGVIISLNTQPLRDVTVSLVTDDHITLEASSLTFTEDTWDIPQTILASAIDDAIGEDPIQSVLSFTVASEDGLYEGYAIDAITITVNDDDPVLITSGKYLTVFVNAEVVSQKKVGASTIRNDHLALQAKKLYPRKTYTTVATVETRNHVAKLVVFRLSTRNILKKRRVASFTVPHDTPVELRLSKKHKRITVTISEDESQVSRSWRLTPAGELQAL